MPPFKDITGLRTGKLVAKKYLGNSKWLCLCDCGRETIANSFDLIRGSRKSCGCSKSADDKTGMKFNKLTVIGRADNGTWMCECECGNITYVTTSNLKHTKSCGCQYAESMRNRGPLNDLTEQRFGRLTAIEYVGDSKWRCKCDCGNETVVASTSLVKGRTKSCGCLQREKESPRTTHGMAKTRLYDVWTSMKQRCLNPNNKKYPRYGGRGISICDEWLDFKPFYEWAIASGYDADAKYGECTIDRIDNDGNYEPSNCRWVDLSVQAANRSPRGSGRSHS